MAVAMAAATRSSVLAETKEPADCLTKAPPAMAASARAMDVAAPVRTRSEESKGAAGTKSQHSTATSKLATAVMTALAISRERLTRMVASMPKMANAPCPSARMRSVSPA